MKFVDAFLFSEPHEANLLWLKLKLESGLIDEWLILENAYTTQGEYKGCHAEDILCEDKRFSPFLDRIKVIQGDFIPAAVYNKKGVNDQVAFSAEHRQRELARSYLCDHYESDDWVLVSDVDEMIDASNVGRRALLLAQIAKAKGLLRVPRVRYWFDFDNLWSARRATPFISMDMIRHDTRSLGEIRDSNIGPVKPWDETVMFEYSFCFGQEQIERKYRTQAHTGFEWEEIQRGLCCNHVPMSQLRGHVLTLDPNLWLEKVELNRRNSPAVVRDNFAFLRTNVVDPFYKRRRQACYPSLFPLDKKSRYINAAIKGGYKMVNWLSLQDRRFNYLRKIPKMLTPKVHVFY